MLQGQRTEIVSILAVFGFSHHKSQVPVQAQEAFHPSLSSFSLPWFCPSFLSHVLPFSFHDPFPQLNLPPGPNNSNATSIPSRGGVGSRKAIERDPYWKHCLPSAFAFRATNALLSAPFPRKVRQAHSIHAAVSCSTCIACMLGRCTPAAML